MIEKDLKCRLFVKDPYFESFLETQQTGISSLQKVKDMLQNDILFEMVLVELKDRYGTLPQMDVSYNCTIIAYILVAIYHDESMKNAKT